MPLKIIRQDVTKIKCDAVVVPTNSRLLPGGGTDEAIHRAAGTKLIAACKELGVCETGKACMTAAYDLPCKHLIHTCGPVWQGGKHNEEELLVSCYRECLLLADRHNCESLAFPLISSGRNGFPKDKVLKIALRTISEFLFLKDMTVYIAVYDKDSYEISKKLFDDVKNYLDDNVIPELGGGVKRLGAKYKSERHYQSRSTEVNTEDYISDIKVMGSLDSALCGECAPIDDNFYVEDEIPLEERLKNMDKGFADTLFELIDKKGISDVECYKRANIDKKTFSKIKCNKEYRPSKKTVVSFAIGLKLNMDETNRLLNTVGMSLSRSSKFDVIIEYFITVGKYESIFDVNEVLYKFDQVTLGV